MLQLAGFILLFRSFKRIHSSPQSLPPSDLGYPWPSHTRFSGASSPRWWRPHISDIPLLMETFNHLTSCLPKPELCKIIYMLPCNSFKRAFFAAQVPDNCEIYPHLRMYNIYIITYVLVLKCFKRGKKNLLTCASLGRLQSKSFHH